MTGDRAEPVFCAFFPSFGQTSPAGSPKPPHLIRSVQRGEWLAVNEPALRITWENFTDLFHLRLIICNPKCYCTHLCPKIVTIFCIPCVPKWIARAAGVGLLKVRLHKQSCLFPLGSSGKCMNREAAFRNQKSLQSEFCNTYWWCSVRVRASQSGVRPPYISTRESILFPPLWSKDPRQQHQHQWSPAGAVSGSSDATQAGNYHTPLEILCKISWFFVPGGRLSWEGFLHHFPFLSPHTVVCGGHHLGEMLLCHFEVLFFPGESLRFQQLCK